MTIEYYQNNAGDFFANTCNVDMQEFYQPFIKPLKPGARILDAGCGSGRDALAFKKMGYNVEAFDASTSLAEKASEFTGLDVKLSTFENYTTEQLFDGIWTCASLLHVPRAELVQTAKHLANFLSTGGVWYMSFKYGNSDRETGGRRFTDLDEKGLQALVEEMPELSIKEIWTSEDKRPDRTEVWLNAILKKGK